MARPQASYKIGNSNTSSYNIIAPGPYTPPTPPFWPETKTVQIDPEMDYESPQVGGASTHRQGQERERWNNMNEKQGHHFARNDMRQTNHAPPSPLYRPSPGQDVSHGDPQHRGYHEGRREEGGNNDYQGTVRFIDGAEPSQNKRDFTGEGSMGTTIGNVNQVPVSPLYRPGMGKGLSMADPRFGDPQGRGRQPEFPEVRRPRNPPTPDYNTTNLQLPNSNDQEMKLQLGALGGSQEDLRDYRTNNAVWPGYQDRPTFRDPLYTERPGYRSHRENPWTSREFASSYVADPRIGGQHDGIGLVGSRNGGALLFIRFPVGQDGNANVAAQAFLKSKTQDTGGRFLGLAKQVFDFGYERGPTEGVGVFHFPSIEKAFMFFQMDPILRQPDFPPPNGHAESWIVNNTYLPDNLDLFNTFLLSEIELHNGKTKREFFESFQKPFESYLYKNGAMPYIICSYGEQDRKSVRRHMYPSTSIVTCHLFQGLDHLNWITNDETYSKFRSLHNQMAIEKCSIFNIRKDMFP